MCGVAGDVWSSKGRGFGVGCARKGLPFSHQGDCAWTIGLLFGLVWIEIGGTGLA